MDQLASLTIAHVAAGVIVVALNVYVVLGGADFGGGVWDLLAGGPRRDRQRELISHAMGPIWEANHVWLIVVVVLLFVCFPPAFSAFGTVLHLPLSLMLIGIVLRGSAFVFRAYSYDPDSAQRRWGTTFAVSSVITPILLGVCVGAVVSGGVGRALEAIGAIGARSGPAAERAGSAPSFAAIYVEPWLAPFPIAVGVMTLALFAFLAAVYLTVEAGAEGDRELQEDFRRRALMSGVASYLVAMITLFVGRAEGGVIVRLFGSGWAIALHAATVITAVVAMVALARRRYHLARFAAAAQVTVIIWGWAFAQFPLMIPPRLSIDDAAGPASTLRATLIVLAAGALILVPSLWYLLRVFKSPRLAAAAAHRPDPGAAEDT